AGDQEARGAIVQSLRQKVEAVLASGSGDLRRPVLGKGNESSVKGLFIIGDLAGAPVIKLAMAQGVEVVDYIASLPDMRDRTTPSGGVLATERTSTHDRSPAAA